MIEIIKVRYIVHNNILLCNGAYSKKKQHM